MKKPFKSINWNRLEDKIDLATLEKLNSQENFQLKFLKQQPFRLRGLRLKTVYRL